VGPDPGRLFSGELLKADLSRFFPGTTYQNGKNIPNGHILCIPNVFNILSNAPKNTKRSYNIPIVVIPRPSKFYKYCDFWFANIPSGNSCNIRVSAFK
jgi:hypothetical protein